MRVWNRWSEEEWGLRGEAVIGRNVFNLDTGLPLEELRGPLRRLLAESQGHETGSLSAVNRRGRTVTVRVELTSLPLGAGAPGVIVVTEEIDAAGRPMAG